MEIIKRWLSDDIGITLEGSGDRIERDFANGYNFAKVRCGTAAATCLRAFPSKQEEKAPHYNVYVDKIWLLFGA
jgi:hypothetical protein